MCRTWYIGQNNHMSDKQDLENRRWEHSDQPLEFWHKQALRNIGGGSVLDVGCGDGLLLVELAKKGVTDAFGIDMSETGIAKAKQKGLHVALVDISDLRNISDLHGKKFDSITILEVLEHVFDPLSILQSAKDFLSENGSLYMSTPNFNAIGDRIRVLRGMVPWQKRHEKGHVYWMNKSVVEELMKKSGLEIVEMTSLGYRRNKTGEGLFRWLAQVWPSMFALSFFVRTRSK